MRRAKLFLSTLAISSFVIFAFIINQGKKIDGCNPEKWDRSEVFVAADWSENSRREKFFSSLQKHLPGLSENEVINMIGKPFLVYRGDGRLSLSYGLGRLKLFSCGMNLDAMMLVEFDDQDRVVRVSAYAD